jgi:hypothetical protein
MITIRTDDFRKLAAPRSELCVSIYMPLCGLPQDVIRLKNLLDQARDALGAQGMRQAESVALLAEARGLETNSLFWRSTGKKGLVLLIEPGAVHWSRSHVMFEEFSAVQKRFHLVPLVRASFEPEGFFVLALSDNNVSLFRGDRDSLTPIELPKSFPKSLSEVEKGTEFDKGLQYHTSATHSKSGVRIGIAHGKGTPKDDRKILRAEYVRSVVRHLEPLLKEESSRLVLAADRSIQPIFRELCRYPYLLAEGVTGSPDSLSKAELHRRSLEAAGPNRRAILEADRERFTQMAATDRVASHIEQILPATNRGSVDVLFAASDSHIWGRFDGADTVAVHRQRHPDDVDLLDLAVAKALEKGRPVYVLDPEALPCREPIAAILRG